nr:glycerol-3-phosphate acyltransferase, chloroplastic [Tanacetum cinerariifolium]
ERVLTDPLCKPFSMGRNLLCVYSKKHMNDVLELAKMKWMANTRTLKEMALLLRYLLVLFAFSFKAQAGNELLKLNTPNVAAKHNALPRQHEKWDENVILISNHQTEADPATIALLLETTRPYISENAAPFDASSVDNMRRVVEHDGVSGHVYPIALPCYDIMPPPPQAEKEIGERRVISYHSARLSVAPKIDYDEVTASSEGPEEAKEAYSQALYDSTPVSNTTFLPVLKLEAFRTTKGDSGANHLSYAPQQNEA